MSIFFGSLSKFLLFFDAITGCLQSWRVPDCNMTLFAIDHEHLTQQLGTGIPHYFDADLVQCFRPVLRVADYLLPVKQPSPFHIKHTL